ncbi:MAG: T9SS type A sorting domain-containing protein [candidate division Zixibacteria bacterium]|nr:T9SS type A sorting domain-containing protein [candidate division Zixibacteria bacterium]
MSISSLADFVNVPDDFVSIQEAIDLSFDNDTVLVQPGGYFENINFNGHNIILGSLFLTTRDTSYITATVINGNSSGSAVTFENAEDRNTIITGFTIRNGFSDYGGGILCRNNSNPFITYNLITENMADGSGYPYFDGCGGGIYCNSSSPEINNNIIAGNIADLSGGGICCANNSNSIIINNIIVENSGYYSAGIHCSGQSNAMISGNKIIGNQASHEGGGIQINSSDALIYRNLISGNVSNEIGGGICCQLNARPVIWNNVIVDNFTSFYAAGIYCNWNADPVLINNTISNNSSSYGSGIFCRGNSNPFIVNTIIWNNVADAIYFSQFSESSSLTIAYSSVEGGKDHIITNGNGVVYWLEGNMNCDPLFRDPGNGDFHLTNTYCGGPYNSPCIDAGYPELLDSLIDCDRGLGTIRSDMGAYGGGDSVGVWIDDLTYQSPKRMAISQNYPNPFNNSTVIEYQLPRQSRVTIEVYDILGRKISSLVEKHQQSGSHQAIWNADDFSSGVYIYRLQTAEYTESKAMLLLK